jgi:hypothetical protein
MARPCGGGELGRGGSELGPWLGRVEGRAGLRGEAGQAVAGSRLGHD